MSYTSQETVDKVNAYLRQGQKSKWIAWRLQLDTTTVNRIKQGKGVTRPPRLIDWPPDEELLQMATTSTTTELARKIGCSYSAMSNKIRSVRGLS